ncbi:MAG: hypothetical protein AAB276_02245 [Pseudomonadota bacterium]
MVDVSDVYVPLERFYKNHPDYKKHPSLIIDPTNNAVAQTSVLMAELLTYPNVSKLMDEATKSPSGKNNIKLEDAIIQRYMNQNSTFLKDLDRDLGANPAAAAKLVTQIRSNPDQVASNVSRYSAGNLGVFDTAASPVSSVAATPAAPAKTVKAPIAVTPKKEAVAAPVASAATLPPLEENKKTTVEPAATAAVTPTPTSPVIAPVDDNEDSGAKYDRLFGTPDIDVTLHLDSPPLPDPIITTVKKLSPEPAVAPVVTVTSLDGDNKPAAPAVQRHEEPKLGSKTPVSAPPASGPAPDLIAQMKLATFVALADKSDQDIITALNNKTLIKGIAEGIAGQATKMGVGSEYTKSFKDRMDRDPNLMKAFQENLQKNPEFVRQMAKTMKDGGEMPSSMKEIAKKTMQEVMEQPEKLADDGFVKRMSQGMSMKGGMDGLSSMFKGLGDMGGMFAGLGSFFQGIMDKIQSFIKEVSGGEWLSRRNSGRNFLQAFSDTLDQTPNRLASEANAKNSMVVHPMIVGGVPRWTHDESVRDEKGVSRMGIDDKELTSVRPNTFEITTISGSQIKVLPATGVPAVRDAQGNYHMNVVKEMDANNRPSDVQQVVLSVDQFRAYNAHLKQYGDPSMPPQYVMADNNVANIARVGANVTTVEPNGTLGQRVNTAEVAAANQAANKTQPPAPARTPADAANDPEYQLRIKS